jgi:hypothetical protein
MAGIFWTAFELWYLKERYPHVPTEVIRVSLGRTEKSVYMAAKIHGLKKSPEYLASENSGRISKLLDKGAVHRYKKGQRPPNAGRKQKEWMSPEMIERTKATRFKKGTVPPNHKPVGSERICSKDGYVLIKVREGIGGFKLKHRVVYEQHYGPIPKGYNVEFKDRDKRNFSPDNLILRTRKENMKQNTYHNYGPEIAKAIQLRGALNRQINKHLKTLNREK